MSVDKKYIAERDPEQRALLEKLRAIVVKTVPDATAELKWGIPIYYRNGKRICALASFKDFVGINFFAKPAALPDPKKQLEGAGATQRMLKVRTAKDIDTASITKWLKAAVKEAG